MQAKLLRQLNATSSLGWLDHDVILDAYKNINTDFFRNVEVEHASLILSHCVLDMSSEETTFVYNAQSSLLSFVEFSALILLQVVSSEQELTVMQNTHSCWTKSCIQRITKKFLLKHVADAMDGPLSVRKVHGNSCYKSYFIVGYCMKVVCNYICICSDSVPCLV